MKDLWAHHQDKPIPVIDLFAGPGGLGEGFSKAGKSKLFKTALSIEMDRHAHSTLTLRAFQRALPKNARLPGKLIEQLKAGVSGQTLLKELFEKYPDQGRAAVEEALCLELCPETRDEVSGTIKERLGRQGSPGRWVLIGGPPCQAYSLAGRARRSRALAEGTYRKEDDHRHFLYEEYLRIIAEFSPAVFVMENVKGLLSAEVDGILMFDKILEDLRRPWFAVKSGDKLDYCIHALVQSDVPVSNSKNNSVTGAESYLVRSEQFGIPQARHRLILVGVREDLKWRPELLNLKPSAPPTCRQVLDDLPAIRSRLSGRPDSHAGWLAGLRDVDWNRVVDGSWYVGGMHDEVALRRRMKEASGKLLGRGAGPGGAGAPVLELARKRDPDRLAEWFRSSRSELVLNHESRSHMVSDLHRYLFASVFANCSGFSPRLTNFPSGLLPDHKNALQAAMTNKLFVDRFRVQMADSPGTTVTSHISKDGHGFIHYDPLQCRSLTVREAARLQTFPDDYCFLGPRTAQYHQVGNAVPPYLAFQIAEAIARATGRLK